MAVVRSLGFLLASIWGMLALFYATLPWDWVRWVLMLAFGAAIVWSLLQDCKPRRLRVFAGIFLSGLIGFICLSPSHDREWRQEVAVLPRAMIDGDRVRLTGVRNFDYRTREDFDVSYEEREVLLSELTSVDLFLSYWSDGPIGHTFVSFNFEDVPPVCISIEARLETGERYSALGSNFKRHELIYVVGDERDIVRSRTNYRNEEVYLYPITVPVESARRLFQVYLDGINHLADHPEWYHLLSNNCTVNIIRYANAAGRKGSFDFRHLLNGWFDQYLYEAGFVDTSIPFEELRQQSRITNAAVEADNDPDFSIRIREKRDRTEKSGQVNISP